GSVGARRLRRVERQRLGRMPVRAHAGNAHAAGEVAIGKAHPRAAEAALIQLLEMKARLQPPAPGRPARTPPPHPHPSRPPLHPLNFPAGSHTDRTGPAPRNWMVPITEPSL